MPDEYCRECNRETPHDVQVRIREESDTSDPVRRSYSREPYRVSTCGRCGHEQSLRMNDRGAELA